MGRRLFKELERAYGFDEVAIVPGQVTINPDLTSTKMSVGSLDFDIPIMASAMDGAVSPRFAGLMHEMGGLGVLNAEGLYTRYEDPYSTLEEIISMPQEEATNYLQASLLPAHPGASNRGTGAGDQEDRLHLRRFLHPAKHQAHVAHRRRGRGRHGGGAVHRHHGPPHVQELRGG